MGAPIASAAPTRLGRSCQYVNRNLNISQERGAYREIQQLVSRQEHLGQHHQIDACRLAGRQRRLSLRKVACDIARNRIGLHQRYAQAIGF